MKSIGRTLGWVIVMILAFGARAAAKQGYGTLSGVVSDPSGTPQMGATVWLISEDVGGRTVSQLLSNQYGAFFTDHLKPGNYAVRVSLAGFLPAMERHIAVTADLTTLLRVQMNSVFASLDTLRRKSDAPAEPDDWKWVLRSSAATRTILQWRDADPDFAASGDWRGPPGNPAPARTDSADQWSAASRFPFKSSGRSRHIGVLRSATWRLGRLLLAGQMSYRARSFGRFCQRLAAFRCAGHGPETVFVLHQSKFGEAGMTFQEVRIRSHRTIYSERSPVVACRRGISCASASYRRFRRCVRTRGLDAMLAPGWTASLVVAANPPTASWGQTGSAGIGDCGARQPS